MPGREGETAGQSRKTEEQEEAEVSGLPENRLWFAFLCLPKQYYLRVMQLRALFSEMFSCWVDKKNSNGLISPALLSDGDSTTRLK
jgi:hypothetical protein